VIHFDFDNRYQDELVVGSAISRREGFVWSVVAHVVFLGALAQVGSYALDLREMIEEPTPQIARVQPPSENPRFVVIEPLIEKPPALPRAPRVLSDQDRRAETRERPQDPKNDLPFSKGETSEQVEAAQPQPPSQQPQQQQPPQQQVAAPKPEPEPPVQTTPRPPEPQGQIARNEPAPPPIQTRRPTTERPRVPGVLGEAVKNVARYTQNHTFDNPQGGNTDSTGAIQFDSKGVDFGPWLRRFVAQVKRNWNVPLAAMNFRGHVVLQFYVHRNGSITDIRVVSPSSIDSFNTAAVNAIIGSNPTEPLPPEYPDDNVLFTVTFFYNEHPPG
jgi:TonB family protein